MEFSEYTKLIVGLLAILNPLGAVTLYIAMTREYSAEQKRHTSNHAAIGVACILLVSIYVGEGVLSVFGISINSFRVGGGILVLLMAISMLQAKVSSVKQTDEEAHESMDKHSIAIVPLAMPLLAGPGAISTTILAAHKSTGFIHYVILSLGIVLVSAITWGLLRSAPTIEKHLSATGINICTRIMGLILAAIAIEFIANGAKGLFPSLS